jgi:hypothetical protein
VRVGDWLGFRRTALLQADWQSHYRCDGDEFALRFCVTIGVDRIVACAKPADAAESLTVEGPSILVLRGVPPL